MSSTSWISSAVYSRNVTRCRFIACLPCAQRGAPALCAHDTQFPVGHTGRSHSLSSPQWKATKARVETQHLTSCPIVPILACVCASPHNGYGRPERFLVGGTAMYKRGRPEYAAPWIGSAFMMTPVCNVSSTGVYCPRSTCTSPSAVLGKPVFRLAIFSQSVACHRKGRNTSA